MDINIEKYPYFLRHDIEELVKAENNVANGIPCYHIDCLEDELYGSISSAYYGKIISKEEAEYLRLKYLGIDKSFPDL